MSVAVGQPIRYALDLRTSRFTIKAFAGGMLSALGHNPVFAVRDYRPRCGSIQILAKGRPDPQDQGSIARGHERFQLEGSPGDRAGDAGGCAGERPVSGDHLRLSVGLPKRTGDGQYEVALGGSLTLHGVTRPQTINARIVASPTLLRTFGDFTISQSNLASRRCGSPAAREGEK